MRRRTSRSRAFGACRSTEIRRLDDQLYAFNVQATGIADGKLLALFVRDGDGSALGGLYGWTWGATGYIRHLLLPAGLRGRGHGRRLIDAAEAEALNEAGTPRNGLAISVSDWC